MMSGKCLEKRKARDLLIRERLKELFPERLNKSGNFRGTHENNVRASKKNIYFGQGLVLLERLEADDISVDVAVEWFEKIEDKLPEVLSQDIRVVLADKVGGGV